MSTDSDALEGLGAYAEALLRSKCGKVPYPTPAAARKSLRNHGYRIGCRNVYKCHVCHETWHLTSQRSKR